MCWTLIPILCCYLDNGHFTFKKKLWYAFMYNVYFYVIAGIIGVLILASLFIAKLAPVKYFSFQYFKI